MELCCLFISKISRFSFLNVYLVLRKFAFYIIISESQWTKVWFFKEGYMFWNVLSVVKFFYAYSALGICKFLYSIQGQFFCCIETSKPIWTSNLLTTFYIIGLLTLNRWITTAVITGIFNYTNDTLASYSEGNNLAIIFKLKSGNPSFVVERRLLLLHKICKLTT